MQNNSSEYNLFFYMNKGNQTEILEEIRMAYGNECPSRPTVYKWIERFEEGWDAYEDTVRAGLPKSSGLRRNVQLIERILDEDRRATVGELEERSGTPNKEFIALFKMNWK